MKIRKWWILLVVVEIFTSAGILIVKPGEKNKIEFMSTLRWDLMEEKVNSKLEEVVNQ